MFKMLLLLIIVVIPCITCTTVITASPPTTIATTTFTSTTTEGSGDYSSGPTTTEGSGDYSSDQTNNVDTSTPQIDLTGVYIGCFSGLNNTIKDEEASTWFSNTPKFEYWRQCVESCRGQTYNLSFVSGFAAIKDSECHCALSYAVYGWTKDVSDPCNQFQVYSLANVEMAKSCGELYFQHQVYAPDIYRLKAVNTANSETEIRLKCDFSDDTFHGEKLALRSLILGDEKSMNDPNNGVKFMTLDHSNNTVTDFTAMYPSGSELYPWPQNLTFVYVSPVPSADNPLGGEFEFTVRPEDLDNAGIYYFKDPADANKFVHFSASELYITHVSGSNDLLLDFVGMYYDHDKSLTGDGDDFNDDYIGTYVFTVDGTEDSTSSDPRSCSSKCTDSQGEEAFYAARMIDINKFRCKCFTKEINPLLGGGDDLMDEPRTTVVCDNSYFQPHLAILDASTELITFLKDNMTELRSTTSADTADIPNICNYDRTANIVTMYLANFLNLDMSKILTLYTYDYRKERTLDSVFNSSGYQKIAEDTFSVYSGLEQAFWTIVDQYPADSVDTLRKDRNSLWCNLKSDIMAKHCKTVTSVCSDLPSDFCENYLWSRVVHTCYALIGEDPQNKPESWLNNCMPDYIINAGFFPFSLYRRWTRNCDELIPELRDSRVVDLQWGGDGYMVIQDPADTKYKKEYPVIGSVQEYICRDGWELENKTNPVHKFECLPNRRYINFQHNSNKDYYIHN